MEREILIANTKTQKRYKLNTSASTLGELKAELADNNIDYSGMSFTEGISNTQLLDDNSQLPTNLNYKGKTTNNLVILLTNTQKNIPLGAVSAERSHIFDYIRSHNLQERVKEEFGKNMTLVSTKALQNFLHLEGQEDAPEATVTEASTTNSELDDMANDVLSQHGFGSNDDEEEEEDDYDNEDYEPSGIAESIVNLVTELHYGEVLDHEDLDYITEEIEKL